MLACMACSHHGELALDDTLMNKVAAAFQGNLPNLPLPKVCITRSYVLSIRLCHSIVMLQVKMGGMCPMVLVW